MRQLCMLHIAGLVYEFLAMSVSQAPGHVLLGQSRCKLIHQSLCRSRCGNCSWHLMFMTQGAQVHQSPDSHSGETAVMTKRHMVSTITLICLGLACAD